MHAFDQTRGPHSGFLTCADTFAVCLQCYGGHQFGNWAGQLGDGRAISIGEAVHNDQRWELQLKGAGKTPYSRFADGRAVLRSSVREYVASEAMHHLGIPTTRALSLVATNTSVDRDMFYNGDVKAEPGAVVCRVSPSFVRFGTFQLPVSRGEKQAHLTKATADYVIKHHFADLADADDKYLQLLKRVVSSTVELVAKWQLVGFVHGAFALRIRIHRWRTFAAHLLHAPWQASQQLALQQLPALSLLLHHRFSFVTLRAGVLNTDNMSILGVTIDYGPYGFLDKFDPMWTPNLTDLQGRRCASACTPNFYPCRCITGFHCCYRTDHPIIIIIIISIVSTALTHLCARCALISGDVPLLSGFRHSMVCYGAH